MTRPVVRGFTGRFFAIFFLCFFGACDVGQGEGGCLSVDTEVDVEAEASVVESSISVRVTQHGVTFLTERIDELVRLFFEVDEQGRAVIPLDELGVNTLSLSTGSVDAELRDGVLLVALDGLEVSLEEGSDPARLRVKLQDAVAGVQAGVVYGTAGALGIEGDWACGLANGPDDFVAIVSFDISVELATDTEGSLDVAVTVESLEMDDIQLEVLIDCELTECQDGCGECELICGLADMAVEAGSILETALSGALNEVAANLADSMADELLDELLNDRPLVVAGSLDLGRLGKAILPYVAGAYPLDVVGRPSSDTFSVTGSGDSLGLEVELDAGVAASAVHPCVGNVSATPTYLPEPLPSWPVEASQESDGESNPYAIGVALSGAIVNSSIWSTWKSGALCMDLDTGDAANLSGGDLRITASVFDILLPGISQIAGFDAPVRMRLRPELTGEPVWNFESIDDGVGGRLVLGDTEVGLDLLVGGQYLSMVGFRVDIALSVVVEALEGAQVGLRLSDMEISDVAIIHDEVFPAADIELVLPFMADLMLGFLNDTAVNFDVDAALVVDEFLGLNLAPRIDAMTVEGDWLRIFLSLEDAASGGVEGLPDGAIAMASPRPGELLLELPERPGYEIQLRIAGGSWSSWLSMGQTATVFHRRLWIPGDLKVDARWRKHGGPAGAEQFLGEVSVEASTHEDPWPSLDRSAPEKESPSGSPLGSAGGGCQGGQTPQDLSWLLFFSAFVYGLRRRRVLVFAVVVGGLIAGCANDVTVQGLACDIHADCPRDFVCGADGRCEAAVSCVGDEDCCPNQRCFNQWCKQTEECAPDIPCLGLNQTCEQSHCVASACAEDKDCQGLMDRCVGGRCVDDAPCGDGCAEGRACHLPTGRCLQVASCELSCESGWLLRVEPDFLESAESCVGRFSCACVERPEVAAPQPGFYGKLIATDQAAHVLSHDPVYGDLTLSTFPDGSLASVDIPIDGVPELPPTGAPSGYRGGISEPGPHRGEGLAIHVSDEDGITYADALYRADDLGVLHHLRLRVDTGEVVAKMPVTAISSRAEYACLTRDPEDGHLVGWAYLPEDELGEVSQLVRLRSQVILPQGSEDWATSVMMETPLPPREETPCGGLCTVTQICVRPESGEDLCVPAFDAFQCEPRCPAHEVCRALDDDKESVCLPQVYPSLTAETHAMGRGLFVSCIAVDTEIAVAWYDADSGALEFMDGPGGVGEIIFVDGTDDPWDTPDVGGHVSLAASASGALTLAYQDMTFGHLKTARLSPGGDDWRVEIVHEAAGDASNHQFGAWNAIIHNDLLEPVIAYGDATYGDIWLARSVGDACWSRTRVLSTGTYAWPDIALGEEGRVYVSALKFQFNDDLQPEHAIEVLDISAPDTTCDP